MYSKKKVWGIIAAGLVIALLAACTPVEPEMSYQGHLTDPSGNPVPDGTYQMTFRLYDSDENIEWDETQTVTVTNGLFNVNIGAMEYITPSIFAQQLWLGVEVEGDGEMTPRQKLTGAPFAMTMIPGAVIQGGSNINADAPGLLNLSDSGTGYGLAINNLDNTAIAIDGSGTSPNGILVNNIVDHAGWFTATDGIAVLASALNADVDIGTNDDAFMGASTGEGAYLYSRGTGTSDYGVLGRGTNGAGLYAWSSDGTYSGYFPGQIFVGGCTGCTLRYVGRNSSDTTLQPGDVVRAAGVEPRLEGVEMPVFRLAPAGAEDTVLGIVVGRTEMFIVDEAEADGSQPGVHFGDVEGPAAPEDYLIIVVQGPAQVRVDDGAAIQAGDLLYFGPSGLTTEDTGQPLGMAMDAVGEDGLVWVLIGFH